MTDQNTKFPKKKILVVDDEKDLQEVLCFYLKNDGHETKTASSGTEARALLEAEAFDAIISDIRMPHGNGIELLEWVKARSPNKPVVLLITAHSDFSPEDAYNRGAEVILSKPIKSKVLLTALGNALARCSAMSSRKHERFVVPSNAIFVASFGSGSPPASVYNLGRGGAFIASQSSDTPSIGDLIDFSLCLTMDQKREFKGKAIVRWLRALPSGNLPAGYGVEFLDPHTPELQEIILAVIDPQKKAFIPKS